MKRLNIALFGCGVVGSGVYKIIEEQKRNIARQTGYLLDISNVSVLNRDKPRAVRVPEGIITTDGDALLDDPSIDIVIEVIGGDREALGIITRALSAGKKVVTANKVVVPRYLPLLRRLEDLHGGHLSYGASVCGSVPILKIIDETLTTDRIRSLRGVVNGSTNFILSRLADGISWDDALALAREGGFLEADPTADLSGADAAHKLSILAFHAFGKHVPPEKIPTTGIEGVTTDKIAAARERGCTIKLIAEAADRHGTLELSVAPKVIPLTDPLAWVRDEMNIVEVECSGVGTQQFIGKGAGSIPTANAVVSDLLDLLAHRRYQRIPADRSAPNQIEQRSIASLFRSAVAV